jgi:8-oxo-dGTP diphosphatase
MTTDIVAKAVVYTDSGNALLLTRSQTDAQRPGGFDLPGGGVEARETMNEAVLREIFEETGLALTPTDIQLVWAKAVVDHGKNIIRLLYGGKTHDDAVHLSFEHDAFAWVPLESIANELNHPHWSEGIRYASANGLL